MKKKGKTNVIIYSVLGALFIVTVVLVILNQGDRELRRALEENREFMIKVDGRLIATVDLKTLLDLDPQEFSTPFATSIAAPRETTLQGVEVRQLLDELGIDITHAATILVTGLDDYYSPLTRAEVDSEETIYICFSMDGEILKPMSEGGYGPFLLVIRGSRFAQRWCKYVEAIDVITR